MRKWLKRRPAETKQPKTTGEAIQIIRRALYDLARQSNPTEGGAKPNEINIYCKEQGWPVPLRLFWKAMERLHQSGALGRTPDWDMTDMGIGPAQSRYWLTASGDLEEEEVRRGWGYKVLDEIRRPRTFVEFAFVLLGFALGLVSGLLLGSAPK